MGRTFNSKLERGTSVPGLTAVGESRGSEMGQVVIYPQVPHVSLNTQRVRNVYGAAEWIRFE